eukprot:10579379-Prorocentrum_lima.AAC.1
MASLRLTRRFLSLPLPLFPWRLDVPGILREVARAHQVRGAVHPRPLQPAQRGAQPVLRRSGGAWPIPDPGPVLRATERHRLRGSH